MFRKPRQQTLKADLTTRVSRCAVCLRGRLQQPEIRQRFNERPVPVAFQRPDARSSSGFDRNPYTRQFENRRRHRQRLRQKIQN